MSQMTYDAFNHPDEDYLKSIYPVDVIINIPEWMRKQPASKESRKACELYAEAILSDKFLLSQFTEKYDISQNALDSYQHDVEMWGYGRKLPDDIDYDEPDYSKPVDEETFRAQNEEFDKQMGLEERLIQAGY